MRILVTGHRGFIGSHIHFALRHDYDVDGVDYKGGLFISDSDVSQYDTIVHCAAIADVSNNYGPFHNRDDLWRDNVDETRYLLDHCGNANIVFLSSLAVYNELFTTENDSTYATSPYAASKIAGEALIQAYRHQTGSHGHVLRLGCVVGSRYSHGHIKDFVSQHRANGIITPKSSGFEKRSHIHVDDVVSAVLGCVRQSYRSGIYNVTSGTWSCRDTARLMGVDVSWPMNSDAWFGDQKLIAQSHKLREQGWVSTGTIESGVKDALVSLGWK